MKHVLLIAFVTLSFSSIVAFSQQPPEAPDATKPVEEMDFLDRALTDPRVIDRALVEPEFLDLVLADPKLGLVVAVAKLRLPLPDRPETLRSLRESYRLVGPPPPAYAQTYPGMDRPLPPRLPKPLGFYGTQTKLSRPEDPEQQEAARLLKQAAAPAERIVSFQKAWKELRFLGWQVDVREVETVDGVTTIKARVYPISETKEGGLPVTLLAVVDETYQLVGGKLRLLKIEAKGSISWIGL